MTFTEDNSKFSDVRQRVENIYANTYLQKITPKWNKNFTNDIMNATDLPKQEDFYKHYLRGYDGKQRVIVIISDAFRYECAKELFGRLELDEKCTPKMECMLSCLPSVTSVGIASLLPRKEMQVDGSLNVTVDGQACASMEQRDKILKSYNENNVALSFDEVANANQARIRELIQGKNRDDKIDLFEVPSKSDDPDKLVERMKEVNKQLGDRAGDINLVYIKK